MVITVTQGLWLSKTLSNTAEEMMQRNRFRDIPVPQHSRYFSKKCFGSEIIWLHSTKEKGNTGTRVHSELDLKPVLVWGHITSLQDTTKPFFPFQRANAFLLIRL